MKVLLALVALAGFAQLPCARAVQGCPDTSATQIAGYTAGGKDTNQCVLGITLFGITIGIDVGNCPLFQYVYPAHQICAGQSSEGTECIATGDMEVRLLKCRCNFFGGQTLGIGLPGCDCQDSGTGGTVEDAKTINCVTPPASAN